MNEMEGALLRQTLLPKLLILRMKFTLSAWHAIKCKLILIVNLFHLLKFAGSELRCKGKMCVESCQENWVENGDDCYYWSTTALNWTDAEDFCRSGGGHLASVTSEATNEFVLSELERRRNSMLWIGGTAKGMKGGWKWTDCTPMVFTYWQKNQPSNHEGQDCLRYSRTAERRSKPKWNDLICSLKQKFVCSQKLCPGMNSHEDMCLYSLSHVKSI